MDLLAVTCKNRKEILLHTHTHTHTTLLDICCTWFKQCSQAHIKWVLQVWYRASVTKSKTHIQNHGIQNHQASRCWLHTKIILNWKVKTHIMTMVNLANHAAMVLMITANCENAALICSKVVSTDHYLKYSLIWTNLFC